MRQIFFIMIASFILLTGEDQSVSAEKERFEKIFDGKSFDNWVIEGASECWIIHQQRLCSVASKKGKWIRTSEKLGEFILKFEWKIEEGSESGILIGLDEEKNKNNQFIRIPIVNQLKNNFHCTGSINGIVPVDVQPDSSPERWHSMKIQHDQKGITVECDGIVCTQYKWEEGKKNLSKSLNGYLALQAVTDMNTQGIEFRDIQLQKLETTKNIEQAR